jgi:hypothetical protein
VAVLMVHTAMITSVPTTTQKAIGPMRSWRPAWMSLKPAHRGATAPCGRRE